MRATPIQTAVTAVLATACGLFSAWYVPAFALSVAVGAVAYLTAIGLIAKATHLEPIHLIADTTRLAIRVVASTITVLAGLLLNWCARFDHVIATAQQQTNSHTVRSTTI